MKTIREHFEDIQDPVIREKAIQAIDEGWSDKFSNTLSLAISLAFIWGETQDGDEFWREMHRRVVTGEAI